MGKVNRKQVKKGGRKVGTSAGGKGSSGHHGKKKQKHTWKSVREKKRLPGKQLVEKTSSEEPSPVGKSSQESSCLRSRMLERLSIARFRTLNADIDASPQSSGSSNPLSRKETFKSYHTGFETASSLWKQNPLDLISDWIKSSVPKDHLVADFGCGTGRLAKLVPQRTYSFDLHALEDHVTECDMRDVPLEDASVHVVVFCLSLMGSDVTQFLEEARRVLVDGGVVKIAEAAARLNGTNMRKFVGGMKGIGFQKVGSVQEIGGGHGNTHVFVIMEFKKICGFKKKGKREKVLLGPCVYKKR